MRGEVNGKRASTFLVLSRTSLLFLERHDRDQRTSFSHAIRTALRRSHPPPSFAPAAAPELALGLGFSSDAGSASRVPAEQGQRGGLVGEATEKGEKGLGRSLIRRARVSGEERRRGRWRRRGFGEGESGEMSEEEDGEGEGSTRRVAIVVRAEASMEVEERTSVCARVCWGRVLSVSCARARALPLLIGSDWGVRDGSVRGSDREKPDPILLATNSQTESASEGTLFVFGLGSSFPR